MKLWNAAAAAAKSLQSCPTLRPHRQQPTRLPVPGILQARTLEWVAISFSNAWKWKVKVKSLSRVWLLATPWTAAYQAPLSIGFFQARVLEWGAIVFSKLWNRQMHFPLWLARMVRMKNEGKRDITSSALHCNFQQLRFLMAAPLACLCRHDSTLHLCISLLGLPKQSIIDCAA